MRGLGAGEVANMAEELARNVAKETENSIMEQLNEFIKRGLIVVESKAPTLVRELHTTRHGGLKVMTSVKLKLKDQEYIENLEKKVKILEDFVGRLKEIQNED